jgi:hypothetical protein
LNAKKKKKVVTKILEELHAVCWVLKMRTQRHCNTIAISASKLRGIIPLSK